MQESRKFCAKYLKKFSTVLDGIWQAVERSPDEPHIHFILSDQYSRDRSLLTWFWPKSHDPGSHSDVYKPISFQLGMMIDTPLSSKFWYKFGWLWPSIKVKVTDTHSDDLDLQSKSQLYDLAKTRSSCVSFYTYLVQECKQTDISKPENLLQPKM